jgi:putative glutamine amidotransferase
VPSYHHQALGRLGEGLVATAEAPDGLVEAVEDPSRGFCLGVMWHPDEDVAGGMPLFRGLVEAARAYAAARIKGDEGRHT